MDNKNIMIRKAERQDVPLLLDFIWALPNMRRWKTR